MESILADLIMEIVEKEWDEEFKNEYGIQEYKEIENFADREYSEVEIIFKDKESKEKYIEDFQIPQ
jgi:hypothetical protein